VFTEDLDVFFQDFGVPVAWQRAEDDLVEGLGLLDSPDEVREATLSISTAYALTVRNDTFGGISEGAEITVDGDTYLVAQGPLKLSDGKLCVLGLEAQ
jgi:hypothetical protein